MSILTYSQTPFPPSCAPSTDCLSPYNDVSTQNGSSQPENVAGYITHVPGDPAVSLLSDDVHAHLSRHLENPLLDELYEKLWAVAKKSSRNIDPLHTQKVKGRSIIPTEDPRLHLTWHWDRIYIKPVPVFLLNYEFWTTYLQPSSSSGFNGSIAVGFLRSYALLLQWSKFISHFRHLPDESVARRYRYGQLRLSRLNWAVRIFRPQHTRTVWFYEIPHWSISSFMSRAIVPLLFVFAGISLALSSMQVALSVPTDDPWFHGLGESGLQNVGRAFWALLLRIPIAILVSQVSWGLARERRRAGVTADRGRECSE
ncbi:hypothetical protein B0T26DRAFT_744075 [Lasiosphaeria miniovina]|uniref:Uncharacterized protein n=1 Tax=Lasiosphaeria miniovina TaxID=1954250 RepID=A0AA40A0G8_9PEZI|nr:uncharacterized protein B0T26DRAFT_744075 [Lasiosphaeria miniovina]KAK0707008.1 hypothetical protein B0T26DRAFT_744075 [Lasiosphaeria miniovina]